MWFLVMVLISLLLVHFSIDRSTVYISTVEEYDHPLFMNKIDPVRRASILNIPNDYPFGGIRMFNGATVKQIKTLLDEGFLDPEDAQNDSPTAIEFFEFMQEHPTLTAHGYVVEPARIDCRVTIEGLEGYLTDPDDIEAFKQFCVTASELTVNECTGYVYSWWD